MLKIVIKFQIIKIRSSFAENNNHEKRSFIAISQ